MRSPRPTAGQKVRPIQLGDGIGVQLVTGPGDDTGDGFTEVAGDGVPVVVAVAVGVSKGVDDALVVGVALGADVGVGDGDSIPVAVALALGDGEADADGSGFGLSTHFRSKEQYWSSLQRLQSDLAGPHADHSYPE